MSEYKELYLPSGPVLVEVENADGGSLSVENFSVIRDLAVVSVQEMQQIEESKRPQSFELSFGLKAVAEYGQLAVSLGRSSANFQITIRWSSEEGASGILGSDTFSDLGSGL